MRKDIHPDYHKIKVVRASGDETIEMMSTLGNEGHVLNLDIDDKTHPAWTGQRRMIDRGGQVDKFKRRYQNLGQ